MSDNPIGQLPDDHVGFTVVNVYVQCAMRVPNPSDSLSPYGSCALLPHLSLIQQISTDLKSRKSSPHNVSHPWIPRKKRSAPLPFSIPPHILALRSMNGVPTSQLSGKCTSDTSVGEGRRNRLKGGMRRGKGRTARAQSGVRGEGRGMRGSSPSSSRRALRGTSS